MNPKPVIVASICAVLFVVGAYSCGKYGLEQERVEDSKLPVVPKTKRSLEQATESTETVPSDTKEADGLTDKSIYEQEIRVTEHPSHTVDTLVSTTTESTETPQNKDEPVSPHGFGPYPKVPDDYPWPPNWELTHDNPKRELLSRVRIKLWKQGIRADGVGYCPSERIYPIIRSTIYITWKEDEQGRYIGEMTGHPDDDHYQIEQALLAGDTPDGITVLEHDEAGIDPYEFLNLNQQNGKEE